MVKLVIDSPEQQIIEVHETGNYFGDAVILWDERTEGPLPAITLGGMVKSGDALIFDQPRKDQHDAVIAARQAEHTRIEEIEAVVKGDTIIAQLKAMDNAAYSAWFDANVTTMAQAIQLLKRLTRVIIRRVL